MRSYHVTSWFNSVLLLAAAILACSVLPVTGLSIRLQHVSITVNESSFAAQTTVEQATSDVHAAAAAAAAAASDEDVQLQSDQIFNKAKFAVPGSHRGDTSASFSSRKLQAGLSDKQFFVQFSIPTHPRILLALHKVTGGHVVAHVHDDLYVAIGDEEFAKKARQFPGVLWAQEREGASKIGSKLQMAIQQTLQAVPDRATATAHSSSRKSGADSGSITTMIAHCWFDGCGTAAVLVKATCPDVYVHPSLVEVLCPDDQLHQAVSILSQHIGIDFVELKEKMYPNNFGGRAILGPGVDATTPAASRVLSNIDVSNSVIAVADSGIDVNNCFFYDANAVKPWNNSRVVKSYVVQPCENCGNCCNSRSPSSCSNSINTCGNFLDQSGHGTHVCGTVAGAGPSSVQYANGIASGAKIFFQDIENYLNASQCWLPPPFDCSGLNPPTDLANLFSPALQAGACVFCLHFYLKKLNSSPTNSAAHAIKQVCAFKQLGQLRKYVYYVISAN